MIMFNIAYSPNREPVAACSCQALRGKDLATAASYGAAISACATEKAVHGPWGLGEPKVHVFFIP